MSELFRLNVKDLARGAVVAGIVVLLASLQSAFEMNGLDFTSFDWEGILQTAITAGIAYLGKNLISDSSGKVLGRVG